MLTRDNILYPEEFFPHTTYSHNDGRFGLLGEEPRDIVDWEMFYRAGEYIKRFRSKIEKGKDKKIFGDISNYSFAVFQSNDSRSYTTRIGGYISFPSEEVNSILGIPPETTVKEAMEKQGRREISIDNPIGYLGTNIFPDTDYMLTINYQNTPIGFLGFDIV